MNLVVVLIVRMEIPFHNCDKSSGPEDTTYMVNETIVVFNLRKQAFPKGAEKITADQIRSTNKQGRSKPTPEEMS